jgi:hypothetical protein
MAKEHRSWLIVVLALTISMFLVACDLLGGGAKVKPSITINAPGAGAQVPLGQEVLIRSTSLDEKGVTKVELIVDGVPYRVDPSINPEGESPFVASQPWVPSAVGSHTIAVKAYDGDGLVSDPASISLVVVEKDAQASTPSEEATATATTVTPPTSAPPTPTETTPSQEDAPPTLEVTSPASGASFPAGSVVQIQASATDDLGVQRVELWVDDELVSFEGGAGQTAKQATLTWTASTPGDHTVQVKALDTSWQASNLITLEIEVVGGGGEGITPTGRYYKIWRDELGGPSAAIGLATSDAVVRLAAEQFFEHGYMYWRDNLGSPDLIYVLNFGGGSDEDKGTWRSFQDTWTEGDPEDSCPAETPPSGLYKPLRGFGHVWCTQPTVKSQIGWSTEAKENPLENNAGFQDFQHGVMLWSGRQDVIYVLYDDGGWKKYPDDYQ